MIKYFLLVFMYSSIILSQAKQNSVSRLDSENITESNVHVYLGIRDEIIIMFGNLKNKTVQKSNLPINLHLAAGVGFLNHYKIDARFGFIFIIEDFWGYDAGLYFLADLFNTNFFATVGIDHFNGFISSHNQGGSGGDITFLCLGFGYNTSKNFNLDIMYYIPDRRVFGFEASYYGRYNMIVNALLRIGFQYSFKL